MPRRRTSCSASRISTRRTSEASASSSLRRPSACSGRRCWPGFQPAGMPLSPTRASSRASVSAASPNSVERAGVVDELALAQRHQQARQQHVVVGLQLRERRHQLDAAQGVFARGQLADGLERGAHPGRQRTDVDLGGFHDRWCAGGRGAGVRRPREKRYDTTTDLQAQCRVVICRESAAADGAGRLRSGTTGGRDCPHPRHRPGLAGHRLRHHRLARRQRALRGERRHPHARRGVRAAPAADLRRRAGTGAAVRARGSRDRARVHAPQRRQRAQARPGARRRDLRRVLRRRRRCTSTRRARSSWRSSARAARRRNRCS